MGQVLRTLDPELSRDVNILPNKVDIGVIKLPLAAINVGLESFKDSVASQHAQIIQVDWRPPASGNEKLMALLDRMKNK